MKPNLTIGNLIAVLTALMTAWPAIYDALLKVVQSGSVFFAALAVLWTVVVAQVAPLIKKQ